MNELTAWARSLPDVDLVNEMHREYLQLDISLDSRFGILHDVLVERYVELSSDITDSSKGNNLVEDMFPEIITDER